MGKKTWNVTLEDGPHTIEIDHSSFNGKRTVRVDGRIVDEAKKSLEFASLITFPVGQHTGQILITSNGIFNYDFGIDGRSVATGQPMPTSVSMPRWAWIFIIACIAIPIITLGGALPALLGAGGASLCAAFASNPRHSQATKLGLCIAVTATAWILLLALGFAIASA